ncbi:PREDICTED: NAC domain-containing protein 1-like [Camelina sativa]|uniref:NAC domain-containing protein 1-like n=1 Tax=Camelina sativa TaxID=90675 RepID=A0ABM0WQE2_CAMSA|nr:PREDICTED: NAC domain-containing protein 1-like [Camelina sativa]
MDDVFVGFGFRPRDDELVGYYLYHKIMGNTRLVEWAINEVNICDFDPWTLRLQSKIESTDRMCYFFSRRENKYARGNRQNRKTPSGRWKLTGEHTDVKDQFKSWPLSATGHDNKIGTGDDNKIGHKRVVQFRRDNGIVDTDWVIHEYYHDTILPEHLRTTYVICRLEYKGNDKSILSAKAKPTDPYPSFVPAIMTNSAGSVVNQSGYYNTYSEYDSTNHHGQQFNEYLNMLDQFPQLVSYDGGQQMVLDDEVYPPYNGLLLNENCNVCIPKKPVTGFFTDDSCGSDTDSMIGSDNSSVTEPDHTPIDDKLSLNTTKPLHNSEAQEQLELHLQGQEKVISRQESNPELEMAEDSTIKNTPSTKTVKQEWVVFEDISRRKSQWIYLKNMIIGFLLFISIIGWIIGV